MPIKTTDRLLATIAAAFAADGRTRLTLGADLGVSDCTVGRIIRADDARPPRCVDSVRRLAAALGARLDVDTGRAPASPTAALLTDLRLRFRRSGRSYQDLYRLTDLQSRTLHAYLDPDEPAEACRELDVVLRLAAALRVRVRLVDA